MSKQLLHDCVRDNLEQFFNDLDGTQPSHLYDMMLKAVERPVLEVVLARANHNQSKAAQWLGLNRNTLRKKMLDHGLTDS